MSLEHVDSSYDSVHEVHSAANGLPFLAESLSSVSLSFRRSAFLVFLRVRPPARSNIVVESHSTRHRERYVLFSRFDSRSSLALSAGRALFTCITERRGDYQLEAVTHSYSAHHGSRCRDNPLQFLRPDVARSMEYPTGR